LPGSPPCRLRAPSIDQHLQVDMKVNNQRGS
jgi:hypothetical protein